MIDINNLTNSLSKDKIDNCLSGLLESLKDQLGFTVDEIDSIKSDLEEIFKSVPSVSDISNALSDASSEASRATKSALGEAGGAADGLASLPLHRAHEIYNAEVSNSHPEPILIKSHGPAPDPVDIEKADYTTKEHYPFSDGQVDPSKNWYKVDQKNHLTERAHSSKDHFKVDEEGNITVHVQKNIKFVVEGNMSTWIKGAQDMIVNKGDYIRVKGERIETIHDRVMEKYMNIHVTNCGANRWENAPNIYHNSGGPSVPS